MAIACLTNRVTAREGVYRSRPAVNPAFKDAGLVPCASGLGKESRARAMRSSSP